MNLFHFRFWRSPLPTALLMLLLTVGTLFCTAGAGTWFGVRTQSGRIGQAYTTIAIPYNKDAPSMILNDPDKPGFQPIALADVFSGSDLDVSFDRRVLLGATAAGMQGLSHPARRPTIADPPTDELYCAAVLAVRCERTERTEMEIEMQSFDGSGQPAQMQSYRQPMDSYTLRVQRVLCAPEREAKIPETLIFTTEVCRDGGAPLFSEGNTYLVRGVWQSGQFSFGTAFAWDVMTTERKDDLYYTAIRDEKLPIIAAYSGDLDAFLGSAEGSVWRDTILPATAQSYRAVRLMLTDRLKSIYYFNTGDAVLLEGRIISEEEYRDGAKVCLISSEYAALNDLSVGSSLNLTLHHPKLQPGFHSGAEDNSFLQIGPCLPENVLRGPETYRVIGVYSAPGFAVGAYAFPADTIFAPKASVPEAKEMEADGAMIPLLNSIIIRNGTQEAVEQWLSQKGLDGYFLYFDQGYQVVSGATESMRQNAVRLLAVGAAVFLLTLVLFLYLWLGMARLDAEAARRIGVSAKVLCRQAGSAQRRMLLTALGLGWFIGMGLVRELSRRMFSQAVPLSVPGLLLCLAVLAMLCLLASAWTLRRFVAGMDAKRR